MELKCLVSGEGRNAVKTVGVEGIRQGSLYLCDNWALQT
jgi:hypothetical protein